MDDDEVGARWVVTQLRRYEAERGTPLAVTRYADGADVVAGYDGGTDVLLLDVEMPGLDGLSAAARIRERDHDVAIVLVSHAPGHAIDGYGVGAQGFLVKPVSYTALSREMDRVVERSRRRTTTSVVLSTDGGPLRLGIAEIVYLEADRRRVRVHTVDGRYTVAGPLKDLEAGLADKGFFRLHHGFVVNLRHVVGVRQTSCRLVTRREIPISRPRRSAFLAALTDHLAGNAA
ncbi:MAG TPA: LytTR family DNA-binding domain-containing protein [Cellulomonas sp.]